MNGLFLNLRGIATAATFYILIAMTGNAQTNYGNLSVTRSNSTVFVTWTNTPTVLQSAPSLPGPWTQMPVATSPLVINPTNTAGFYRFFYGCTSPPAGIVSWWPGDGSAVDIVSSNNGSLFGSASFTNGLVGQAFSLNGSSAYVLVPNADKFNPTGPFSVEFWVHASSTQNFSQVLLVDKSHGWTDNTGWLFQTSPNSGLVGFGFGLGGSGPPYTDFASVYTTSSVLDNHWHHLAGVWTGSELQIYFDGSLQGAAPQTPAPVNNTRDVEFGRSWGGGTPTRFLNGSIDEVSYYNSALSSNQVYAIYIAGAAGKCKP